MLKYFCLSSCSLSNVWFPVYRQESQTIQKFRCRYAGSLGKKYAVHQKPKNKQTDTRQASKYKWEREDSAGNSHRVKELNHGQ